MQIGNGTTTGSALPGTGTVTVGASGSLAVNLATGKTFANGVSNSGVVNAIASGVNTLSGPISGTGSLAQLGRGTTTVSNGALQLSRATPDNSAIPTDVDVAMTSNIVISGGNLVIAASEQIGNTGSINMSRGSFGFSGSGLTETIDKLTTSGGTFSTGANTLEVLGATVT